MKLLGWSPWTSPVVSLQWKHDRAFGSRQSFFLGGKWEAQTFLNIFFMIKVMFCVYTSGMNAVNHFQCADPAELINLRNYLKLFMSCTKVSTAIKVMI